MKENKRLSCWRTIIVLSLLVAATQSQQLVSSPAWRLANVQCAPDNASTTIGRFAATRETHCVMTADDKLPTGALVAQFDQLSGSCSVFNFQSICRSLSPGQSPHCAVFYRFPINHRSMSSKLNNVWVGDAVSRLENLMCQADEDTNRLHPVAVQWSSEGAVFDGSSAYAVLNKSSLSFATGLTWLLRLKRQPQVQPIIEFTACSAITGSSFQGICVWEYQSPRQVFVRTSIITGSLLPAVYSPINSLSDSSDDWLNIGFTASGGSFDLFLSSAFLASGTLILAADSNSTIVNNSNLCLYVGMRVSNGSDSNYYFRGTMRAVAFSSARMTEAEIHDFFNLIS